MGMRQVGFTALIGAVLGGGVALAAGPDPASVQAPVKGVDVMGDKGRSGPDGWVWAPVARDQSPADKAAGETDANKRGAPNRQASNDAGKALPPGQDPGTPAVTQNAGPGVTDAAANNRRP